MLPDQLDARGRGVLHDELFEEYRRFQAQGLQLNMARGKPSDDQLKLSMPLLHALGPDSDCLASDGTDCRNYGVLEGIPEARKLMAVLLDDDADNVIVCGNASLNIEYDTLARCWMFGTGGHAPWGSLERVKWLCPAPGYDRHFAITESFGAEMVVVPMDDDGPDMDLVESLVAEDDAIKGIWCVPQYSNPTGATYSDEVVVRLARMECAAPDFRIFWDNAYCVHHLQDDPAGQEHVADIGRACQAAGTPERYYKFASTSKITFPGAGISAIAASPANIAEIKERMGAQTIGHNKLNQLAHVEFLQDAQGIARHMSKHAKIIRPKFGIVLEALNAQLAGWGCTWTNPSGGYFICFKGRANTATRTVELARDAGVVLTSAGATHPYHRDPEDAFIRIAPTMPSAEELEVAMQVFCCCAKLACLEALSH